MIFKCLIVDDSLMARKSLEQLCSKRADLAVVTIFDNAQDALTYLHDNQIDILFLDVEMPEMTGLELLNELPYQPYVILTTSKTEYAFDAYQYDVFDYLKKPISFPRFSQTIDKIILQQNSIENNSILSQKQSAENDKSENEIYVKVESRFVRIPHDEILFVENIGDYVKIYTTKENFVVYTTMKNMEEKLNSKIFFRVHRTYIINLQKIIDIEENNLAISNKIIPISRANKQELMNRLNII